MKLIVAVLLFFSTAPAKADSFLVRGARADALVNSLTRLGLDPVGTHEYFQVGVTACKELHDEKGNYFPSGGVGDYIGESCLVYGDAEGSDPDGALRVELLIPENDRNLTNHPELAAKLEKLRFLREALESVVIPIEETVQWEGHTVLISKLTGIRGIACEGHDAAGLRQCYVLPSLRCPPRE